MSNPREQRIFWLGMHVVLTRTELPLLRQLGYEVFNPPYRSKIYDQSANLDWDAGQPTTLPPEVFEELSQYNFFYNRISPRIAELLNEHFGTIVVTINPDWLAAVLPTFRGRVIYRTFGQPGTLSEALWHRGLFRTVTERDDFWFVPHAEEAVVDELSWLRDRMRVVPYTLSHDVFELRNSWGSQPTRAAEIMVTCPNIRNAYYQAQYRHLNAHFNDPRIKLYGVQRGSISDPRVVGTLPRQELLAAYQQAAGYFYHYQEANVCYLPPIEMMTVGGPVVYLRGSLLAKYFGHSSPGFARDFNEARRMMRRMLEGDAAFIREVVASQEPAARRYAPEHVTPIFERSFREMLSTPAPAKELLLRTLNAVPPGEGAVSVQKGSQPFVVDNPNLDRLKNPSHNLMDRPEGPSHGPAMQAPSRRAYILFHFPGHVVSFQNGEYLAAEGIPRVVRKLADAILQAGDEVVVTCYADQVPTVAGFFHSMEQDGRIRFMVVDEQNLDAPGGTGAYHLARRWVHRARLERQKLRRFAGRVHHGVKRRVKRHLLGRGWIETPRTESGLAEVTNDPSCAPSPSTVATTTASATPAAMHRLRRGIRSVLQSAAQAVHHLRERRQRWVRRRGLAACMARINADGGAGYVVVPHYYHFPEAAELTAPLLLYLPDYIPHFFDVPFDGRNDRRNEQIGRVLARQAATIITNSAFTRSYLPQTVLQVDPQKVEVVPIPLLAPDRERLSTPRSQEYEAILNGAPFIFYPTQNRPNKQIGFLLRVFARLRQSRPDLKLFLTCSLSHHRPAEEVFRELQLGDSVIFRSGVPDSDLSWLYERASALCLTTTMEGNFPPQVFEALTHGTPIVATRLPLITEILEDESDQLLLCDPLDVEQFVTQLEFALAQPDVVRERQAAALRRLKQHASDESFQVAIARVLSQVRRIHPATDAAPDRPADEPLQFRVRSSEDASFQPGGDPSERRLRSAPQPLPLETLP